jgi:hypothetical protein
MNVTAGTCVIVRGGSLRIAPSGGSRRERRAAMQRTQRRRGKRLDVSLVICWRCRIERGRDVELRSTHKLKHVLPGAARRWTYETVGVVQ